MKILVGVSLFSVYTEFGAAIWFSDPEGVQEGNGASRLSPAHG